MMSFMVDYLTIDCVGRSNIEVISEAGGLGGSPPEAIGCFSNITPKSCLIQDLEHI